MGAIIESAFSAAFVATTLSTFAIDGHIVYVMGEPSEDDAPCLTDSLQRPLGSLGPRRPIPFGAYFGNYGLSNTSLAGMRLIPIASTKNFMNLPAKRP